jgi:hypothetical protein
MNSGEHVDQITHCARPPCPPPLLLVGHQHSRTRKAAPRSSWLSNSSLMKRLRGSAGVALGSVAIASSLVTMRARRAFTAAYVDISCCKDGWFILRSLLETGDRVLTQQQHARQTRPEAIAPSVPNEARCGCRSPNLAPRALRAWPDPRW